MNTRHTWIPVVIAALIAAPVTVRAQVPMGTAFTYQGQLNQAGAPVNDTADYEFTLWDADTGGSQIGSLVAADAVDLVNGLFTVVLDFGQSAFAGDARWLEVAVRCPAGGGQFTTLSPRQELTPAPNSIYAETAGSVTGGITGSGTGNYIPKFTGASSIGDSVIYQNSGKIGVGTTSPGAYAKLHVHAGDGAAIKITNDGTGLGYNDGVLLSWMTTNSTTAYLLNRENAPFAWGTNNAECMRLSPLGNVGIGTTSPDYKLDVSGDIRATGTIYGTATNADNAAHADNATHADDADTTDDNHVETVYVQTGGSVQTIVDTSWAKITTISGQSFKLRITNNQSTNQWIRYCYSKSFGAPVEDYLNGGQTVDISGLNGGSLDIRIARSSTSGAQITFLGLCRPSAQIHGHVIYND